MINKENVLFALSGLFLGVILGFLLTNNINQRSSGAPIAQMSQPNQAMPPDHPPITTNGVKQGPDTAAIQAAADVAKSQPDNFDVQMKTADINYQAERYDDAIQYLQKANKLRPDNFETIVLLGNVNYDAGRFPEAEKWYKSALTIKADDINVRTDLGLTFMLRDPANLDSAIAEFRRSLERDPKHIQTLQNLTVALTRKGDAAQARTVLAKFEEVSPGNPAISTLRTDLEKVQTQTAKAEVAR